MNKKKKIAKILDGLMEVAPAFRKVGSYAIMRRFERLLQPVEIQPGLRHLSGKFRMNLGWHFHWDEEDEEPTGWACTFDVAEINSGNIYADTWFKYETDEEFAKSYDRVMYLFEEKTLPLLNKYSTIKDLLDAYDSSEEEDPSKSLYDRYFSSKGRYFGGSVDWRHYHLARALILNNRVEEAVPHLEMVIEKYTDRGIDWQHKRAQKSEKLLDEIRLSKND